MSAIAATADPAKTASSSATPDDAAKLKNPLSELLDAEEARLVSCLPPQLPRRGFDVYVTRRTNFPAQLDRCRKLLRRPPHLCWVHGLGAALPRAANLALQLSDEQLSAPPAIYTSTVVCTDRLMAALGGPDDESREADTGGGGGRRVIRRRFKSALHIRLEAAPAGGSQQQQQQQQQSG